MYPLLGKPIVSDLTTKLVVSHINRGLKSQELIVG